jgi:DASH complex subunit Dad3
MLHSRRLGAVANPAKNASGGRGFPSQIHLLKTPVLQTTRMMDQQGPPQPASLLSPPELTPLEQEVLSEYERLAENMKKVSNNSGLLGTICALPAKYVPKC